MATERLLMRHIREILRLKWTLRRSHRDTARSLGISAGAVASVVTRAKAIGLTWDTVSALSDDALERTLYGPKLALTVARPGPDLVWMHTELRRPGVTLELLHLEYLAAHPDGYRYSAFLRALPALAGAAADLDAPGPHGGRENVCRLRGAAAGVGQPGDRCARGG